MADRLRVSGTCKTCGKTSTVTAQPRRVTWRGNCPDEACKAPGFIAKRDRTASDEPEAEAQTEALGQTRGRAPRRTVPKVKEYARASADKQPASDVRPAGDDEPARRAAEQPAAEQPAAAPRAEQPEHAGSGRRGPGAPRARQARHPYGDLFRW